MMKKGMEVNAFVENREREQAGGCWSSAKSKNGAWVQ